ncbi:MAG: hypothetical protein U5K55_07100 [Aliarcobacter sp.]|nr:hypothetical protein [Aliarcobacter sp.]
MENSKVKQLKLKEVWIKPEVKELDVNKTANNFNLNLDGLYNS